MQSHVGQRALLGLVLVVWLMPGCGGGGGSSTAPTPVSVAPTPVPCTQTLIFQGAGPVEAGTLLYDQFTISTAGRLDVILDWTYADSLMGVYVTRDFCSLDAFNARACTFLIRSEPGGAKPKKASASNVTPGTYYFYVANFSARDESASTQIFVKSETCPPLAAGASAQAREYITIERMRRY